MNMTNNIKQRKFIKWSLEWIETIVVALILAMFIRTFFIQAFKIPTGSMRKTLLEGDHILVNKFIYGARIPFTKKVRLPGLSKPKRGDVVVFVYPKDTKKDFIKRLIAFGGEKIEIREGGLYINGKLLDDPIFANIHYYNKGISDEGREILVPQDSYFVLGDNSGSSQDSRFWGFVPVENLIGKAQVIYWPLNRIRIIK